MLRSGAAFLGSRRVGHVRNSGSPGAFHPRTFHERGPTMDRSRDKAHADNPKPDPEPPLFRFTRTRAEARLMRCAMTRETPESAAARDQLCIASVTILKSARRNPKPAARSTASIAAVTRLCGQRLAQYIGPPR